MPSTPHLVCCDGIIYNVSFEISPIPIIKTCKIFFYYELSLRMEGDSEGEGTDSECEWPSAVLDHGRAMQMAIKHHEARKRVVAEWVNGV
jgi:hypothetical protein